MAKRSGNKSSGKHFSSLKIGDSKALSTVDDNVQQSIDVKDSKPDDKISRKIGLIKSESAPLFIDHKDYEHVDNVPEALEIITDKVGRGSKKLTKVIEETDEIRLCTSLRLSHFVIVDSVLKETNINPNIEAQLPVNLNVIYQRFIGSSQYIENFQAKDEFYRGVGLLGIGVEERIFNKRKALEESLKRGFRLRPNPKPRRQFDGTIINRPLKNRNKFSHVKNGGEKLTYNVFTIGNDLLNKNRVTLRKAMKKKSVMRRAAAQKLELAKKALNEACASSEDESGDNHVRSIALSRAKRQPKVPQLDFKYCYSEGFGGVRNRKHVDTGKVDQFMEIVDSDSSSVVEVFPPADKENSEYSDAMVSHRRPVSQSFGSSKCMLGARKGWRPQETKALNLLDKLRLGLQCTVIQTERDVIIQNLTLEDLSTLRSRLHGLATFKNIEAEYDKNGQETARATIDRRVLNLPFKGYDSQTDPRFIYNSSKKSEESLKRKFTNISLEKKKQITPGKEPSSSGVKVDEFCSSWVRPKVRSVKKIRKLYTQSSSTPNILARSQGSSRPEGSSQTGNRSSSGKAQSLNIEPGNNTSAPPVSFYPQITSVAAIMTPESLVDTKAAKMEPFSPSVAVPDLFTSTDTSSSMLTISTSSTSSAAVATSRSIATTSAQSLIDNSKKIVTSSTVSLSGNGTPATAMSASQLLMLRKGGSQTTNESGPPFSSTISMSGNDQLFANQILKPFKKALPTSSPAKLEIDEEEFELTPSIIAQAKAIDVHVNSNCSPLNSPVKTSFLSKPLIQPAGILTNCRRTIHLTNNPLFQTHNSIPISTPLPGNLLFTRSKHPILDASTLNTLITVPSSTSPELVANIVVSAPTTIANVAVTAAPHPKIKHRKWTHNFLTSNSINFREVLCSIAPKTVPLMRAQTPIVSTSVSVPSTILPTIAPKPAPSSSIIATSTNSPYKPISVPAKGSSVVLKSLLVGSNSPGDLCHLNKSPVWSASKYLATNSNNVQDNSKIKWQVGGSVLPSQPVPGASVSKENNCLDLVPHTDNK